MSGRSRGLLLVAFLLAGAPGAFAQTDIHKCVVIAPADTRRTAYQDKPCEPGSVEEPVPIAADPDAAGADQGSSAAPAPASAESDQPRKTVQHKKPSQQKARSFSDKKQAPTVESHARPKQASSGIAWVAALITLGFAGWLFASLGRDRKRQRESPRKANDAHSYPRSSWEPPKATAPEQWDIGLLMELEWRRFEELCELLLRAEGYAARNSGLGADGGIDLLVPDRLEPAKTFAIAQCKAWKNQQVGVEPVRALWGCRDHFGSQTAIFYSLSGFTDQANEFAKGKQLKLVSGRQMLGVIAALPREDQAAMLKQVTRGDYTTPSCPACETKMIRKTGARNEFWGCPNFRVCGARAIPVRVQQGKG